MQGRVTTGNVENPWPAVVIGDVAGQKRRQQAAQTGSNILHAKCKRTFAFLEPVTESGLKCNKYGALVLRLQFIASW